MWYCSESCDEGRQARNDVLLVSAACAVAAMGVRALFGARLIHACLGPRFSRLAPVRQ